MSYGSTLLIHNSSNYSCGLSTTACQLLTQQHLTPSWPPFWNPAVPSLSCVRVLWQTAPTTIWFLEFYISVRRRRWHPTPVLLPGKSHGRRSLVGCSPWGRWGSDTTERLHFPFSLSCIGEGDGNPLQCSCLDNPRDWGAWWAAIYGVVQSRTRLRRLSNKVMCSCSQWIIDRILAVVCMASATAAPHWPPERMTVTSHRVSSEFSDTCSPWGLGSRNPQFWVASLFLSEQNAYN